MLLVAYTFDSASNWNLGKTAQMCAVRSARESICREAEDTKNFRLEVLHSTKSAAISNWLPISGSQFPEKVSSLTNMHSIRPSFSGDNEDAPAAGCPGGQMPNVTAASQNKAALVFSPTSKFLK